MGPELILTDEWKKRSKLYDQLEWTNRNEYMEKFLKMCDLNSNYYLCDVGTGTGTIAREVAEYVKKVEAVDLSSDMLEIAKQKNSLENITYSVMNAENISFPSNTFDCITARMCFHHIGDQYTAVKRCYDVLKPGGKIVISEGIPPEGARRFYSDVFELKEKRRTYILDNLIVLLEDSNFRDIDFIIHKMTNVSINNWLDNSGLDKETCKKIYNLHLDSPKYIKDAYNMKICNGDIYMDWLFAIVSGVK